MAKTKAKPKKARTGIKKKMYSEENFNAAVAAVK